MCVHRSRTYVELCAVERFVRTSFVFPKSPAHIEVFSISLRERWLTLIRKWRIVTKDNAARSSGDYKGR